LPDTCSIDDPDFPVVWRLSSLHAGGDGAQNDAPDLPPPGRAASLQTSRVLWRAPGSWLLIGDRSADLVAELADGQTRLASELTGALGRLRCRGPAWRLLLQTACPLDLEADAARDSCLASVFGPFDIVIDVPGEDTADIYVARSLLQDFEAALHRALEQI
jgi:heterotetrameric sarcosine oxidase gamma subunit